MIYKTRCSRFVHNGQTHHPSSRVLLLHRWVTSSWFILTNLSNDFADLGQHIHKFWNRARVLVNNDTLENFILLYKWFRFVSPPCHRHNHILPNSIPSVLKIRPHTKATLHLFIWMTFKLGCLWFFCHRDYASIQYTYISNCCYANHARRMTRCMREHLISFCQVVSHSLRTQRVRFIFIFQFF